MTSYVIHFTGTSSNLADWKVIDLTDTEGGYVNPATGHQEIDISGYDINAGNIVVLGIVWADCDTSRNNAIIGVTKYKEFQFTTGSRLSGLNNLSGSYLYEDIKESGTGKGMPVEVNGIGKCIDLRGNQQSGIRRIMLVGLISSDVLTPPFGFTFIITPTKIAS